MSVEAQSNNDNAVDGANGIEEENTEEVIGVRVVEAAPDLDVEPSEKKKLKVNHNHPSSSSSSSTASCALPSLPQAMDERLSTLNAEGGEENGEAEAEAETAPSAVPLQDGMQNGGSEKEEEWWNLKMTWSGKVYELKVAGNDMVYDFRALIERLTEVPPDRQKLIGLTAKAGKLAAEMDAQRFGTLGIKKDGKFIMVGTTEQGRFRDPAEVKLPDVVDDFDVTYESHPTGAAGGTPAVAPADDPRNKRKIREIIERCPITVMNEPRPGKRLLVLDLDYTMVDTKPLLAGSLPADECARPGLHTFLEQVYPYYDIVIWSQTHWRWLESKLVELGVIGGDRQYKVCFVADRESMFPVFTQKNGQPYKHEVKPLAYFWAAFPHWSAKNTIHIDDLSRNFAMNPGEGLRIRAFHGAGTAEGIQDRELEKLGTYLSQIAQNVEDFTTVDHSRWKKGPRRPRADAPPP